MWRKEERSGKGGRGYGRRKPDLTAECFRSICRISTEYHARHIVMGCVGASVPFNSSSSGELPSFSAELQSQLSDINSRLYFKIIIEPAGDLPYEFIKGLTFSGN